MTTTGLDLESLPALPDDGWAQEEFGAARLGDARRTRRLVDLARALGAHPTASVPEACASPARTKAAYRLFDLATQLPADAGNIPAAIRAAPIEATVARLQAHPLVLAVQDTTSLNFTAHPATTGLGRLGADPHHRGLHLHSTLAVTPDGVVQGLLASQSWARADAAAGSRHQRKARPTAEKESQKWLTAARASRAAVATSTTLVQVGDRESDIFDLFWEVRALPNTACLIRAAWDRRITEPEAHLVAAVEAAPVAGRRTIEVPRADLRVPRTARVELRWAAVTLRPPQGRAQAGLGIPLTALLVTEVAPPAEVTAPLRWLLLTSLPVPDEVTAWRYVDWYRYRWKVERYHLVLKSGCRIEQRQLETAERLEVCLAIYQVIALRLLRLLSVGRADPEADGEGTLGREEWGVLWTRRHPDHPVPARYTVREVIREIAGLGGFLGRRRDGEPGIITLWRGLSRLDDLLAGYQLARSLQHDVGNA